ncbi:MAG: cytochrome P460 family protein [Candidatus Eisenbacteria bacterium]
MKRHFDSTARTALGLTVLALTALVLVAHATSPRAVAYPEGFRRWTHVKSMAITGHDHALYSSFGGLHHVYVNAVGRAALEAGKPLPDGSVLAFDLLDVREDGGTLQEGARKFTGVMQRDARAFAATGGWGFEAFAGDSRTERVVKDGGRSCFECHLSRAEKGYVFSEWRR